MVLGLCQEFSVSYVTVCQRCKGFGMAAFFLCISICCSLCDGLFMCVSVCFCEYICVCVFGCLSLFGYLLVGVCVCVYERSCSKVLVKNVGERSRYMYIYIFITG